MINKFKQWINLKSSIWVIFYILIFIIINAAIVYYGRVYDFGIFNKEDGLNLLEEFIIMVVAEFFILGIPVGLIYDEIY